jgi:hypothetical protein
LKRYNENSTVFAPGWDVEIDDQVFPFAALRRETEVDGTAHQNPEIRLERDLSGRNERFRSRRVARARRHRKDLVDPPEFVVGRRAHELP